MKKILLAGAAGLVLSAASVAAQAQSIDYGALEQLFNEPVTTSATGSPQRSTEVPVDMTIISAADIKRSGAQDLPTILGRVAGMDVLNFAASQSDVGIRGYNQARSPRLLVLINGRQVYLDHFGYTDWNALPIQLSEIRQIEVVRGPNSAIFGFNAVSGVVNIITFNPKFDNTNAVEVRAGTGANTYASLATTLHLGDRLAVRVSGGAQHEDEWKNTSTVVLASQLHNPSTVQANIDAVATFNAETGLGLFQAQVYRNELDALTPGRRYLNDITVASVEDLFKIGSNHTIRIGLEHRENNLDVSPYVGAKISYTVWAPSVMWNWIVNPKLSLTAAFREDKLDLKRTGTFPVGQPNVNNSQWDRSISELSANLGAVYKATDQDTLRATYARGVQAPTLLELGGLLINPATAVPTGALITGNPTLEPAIVSNYALTYDRALPALNAKASVKVFHQETKDVKGQFSLGGPDVAATATTYAVYTYKNAGDSKMNGFELAISGAMKGGFHWNADTTYTSVKDKPFISEAQLILRKVDFKTSTPKWRSNLAAGWADSHWTVDGFVHYVSKYQSYNGNVLEAAPDYTTLAGRIAYKLPAGMEVALNGQNLLHDRQSQAKGVSGLQAERRIQIGLTKTW
jgi:outer membrane receptor for ferrienterochelin and colicins